MKSSLAPAPRRDVVQRPLTFEPRKCPLDRLALPSKRLVSGKAGLESLLGQQFFATRGNIDHGVGVVLSPYQMEHCPRRVAFVRHQITRVKTGCLSSGLSQHVRCSLRVMNIARAHVRGDGKFGFAVHQQMQFPPIGVFLDALCAVLDRPSSVGVTLGCLAAIAPRLQRGAVQCHTLPKPRYLRILSAYQIPGHVLHSRQELRRRQPFEEPRERGFVGDVGPVKAARPGDERVVGQRPDEFARRTQAHRVFRDEGTPKCLGGVSFGATACGAGELLKESRVVKVRKESLKLSDDRRGLRNRPNSGIISGNHGKKRLPLARGRQVLQHLAVSLYL